jgi:hypothetical protein
MSSVRFRLAPPNSATNIPKIFPSSHLGEGCRLLTGEGRFESCGGSQSRPSLARPSLARPSLARPSLARPSLARPSLARLCLLAVRNLPSQGGNTGSNPVGGSNHLPVAQMDERPATNREACRFDSCREGQSAGCSSAGRAPRLERGGRRIVTCHPDQQRPLSLNGRAPRSERGYGGSIPSRGANPGAVAKRERGALQKRHESARHRPAPPRSAPPITALHALVARMDRPPPSKRTHAGSNPAESAVA